MRKALVIVPVFAWVGIAALVPYTRFWPESANEGTVVHVPPRPAEPTKVVAAPAPVQPTPVIVSPPRPAVAPAVAPTPAVALQRTVPENGPPLIRELQKELKRVGCYDGDITGTWTTSSRAAMRAFTDRVNASLPIDKPDYILLRLVQEQRTRACGAPCPAGQEDGPDGACVPVGLTAAAVAPKKPSTPAPPIETSSTEKALVITGSAATAAAVAAAGLPQPDKSTAARPVAAAPEPAPPPVRDPERIRRPARQSEAAAMPDGPTPRVGVYEGRRERSRRHRRHKTPAVLRSLERNVKQALRSFGMF